VQSMVITITHIADLKSRLRLRDYSERRNETATDSMACATYLNGAKRGGLPKPARSQWPMIDVCFANCGHVTHLLCYNGDCGIAVAGANDDISAA
jgi:hypothetical protein